MSAKTKGVRFDPRTKLFVVLICGALIFLVNETGLVLFLALMSVYLFAQGMYKKALRFCAGFCILFILQYIFYNYLSGSFAALGFIMFFMTRFVPVGMAVSALSEAPTGELIAALQRLHLPKAVTVPVAVGLRFMPCIAGEFLAIRDAMRLRGIALTSLNTLTHPIMTVECVLVPLLMRSMKISDELAASAFARGIDNPGPRTCLRQIHFGLADGITLAVFCAATVLISLFFIKR